MNDNLENGYTCLVNQYYIINNLSMVFNKFFLDLSAFELFGTNRTSEMFSACASFSTKYKNDVIFFDSNPF